MSEVLRIGVDVGGTNTDAVLLRDRTVLASHKSPTTPDVGSGVVGAITEILKSSETPASRHQRGDDRHHALHQCAGRSPAPVPRRRAAPRRAGDARDPADGRLAGRLARDRARPHRDHRRRLQLRRPPDHAARSRRGEARRARVRGPRHRVGRHHRRVRARQHGAGAGSGRHPAAGAALGACRALQHRSAASA